VYVCLLCTVHDILCRLLTNFSLGFHDAFQRWHRSVYRLAHLKTSQMSVQSSPNFRWVYIASCAWPWFELQIAIKKVAHTRLPSVGFRSWSRLFAVSLPDVSHKPGGTGCHYFPPGLQVSIRAFYACVQHANHSATEPLSVVWITSCLPCTRARNKRGVRSK